LKNFYGLVMASGLLAAMPLMAQAPVALGSELKAVSYVCADGQRVELRHDKPAGVMLGTRGGENFTLLEQVGKTPPTFVTGSRSVVVDKDGLTLKLGSMARQTCGLLPDAPVAGKIWGTVSKLDRMALPAGTRAKVLLVDAARQDVAAVEIASTVLTTTGNQVPLSFLIRYPVERVTPRGMTYRLQARIESADGQLLYITDTAVMVLETDAPQPPVDLMLVKVSASAR